MNIEKNEKGLILIKKEDEIIHVLPSSGLFLSVHPREENAVLISKTPTNQDTEESIVLWSSHITEINGKAFSGTRAELMQAVSQLFHKGGADGAGSGGTIDTSNWVKKTDFEGYQKTHKRRQTITFEGLLSRVGLNRMFTLGGVVDASSYNGYGFYPLFNGKIYRITTSHFGARTGEFSILVDGVEVYNQAINNGDYTENITLKPPIEVTENQVVSIKRTASAGTGNSGIIIGLYLEEN